MWEEEERRKRVCLGLGIFLLLLAFLFALQLDLGGAQYDQALSRQFTEILRGELRDYSVTGWVHVDARGSVDFWMMKSGEFNILDFATSIGAVAGYALGAGKELADRLDTLYFKREVDRFSMGEITAKECLLIYALMERGNLNDDELQGVIMDTIKWTRGK